MDGARRHGRKLNSPIYKNIQFSGQKLIFFGNRIFAFLPLFLNIFEYVFVPGKSLQRRVLKQVELFDLARAVYILYFKKMHIFTHVYFANSHFPLYFSFFLILISFSILRLSTQV